VLGFDWQVLLFESQNSSSAQSLLLLQLVAGLLAVPLEVLGVGEQVQQVWAVVEHEVQIRQMSSMKKLWLAAADAEMLMVVEPPVLVKS
jgi:hypothetical protein